VTALLASRERALEAARLAKATRCRSWCASSRLEASWADLRAHGRARPGVRRHPRAVPSDAAGGPSPTLAAHSWLPRKSITSWPRLPAANRVGFERSIRFAPRCRRMVATPPSMAAFTCRRLLNGPMTTRRFRDGRRPRLSVKRSLHLERCQADRRRIAGTRSTPFCHVPISSICACVRGLHSSLGPHWEDLVRVHPPSNLAQVAAEAAQMRALRGVSPELSRPKRVCALGAGKRRPAGSPWRRG